MCFCHCLSDITIQYPQFYGYSYITFEPLKNSYQTFQITLEFWVSLNDSKFSRALWILFTYSDIHRFTESENGLDGKGP